MIPYSRSSLPSVSISAPFPGFRITRHFLHFRFLVPCCCRAFNTVFRCISESVAALICLTYSTHREYHPPLYFTFTALLLFFLSQLETLIHIFLSFFFPLYDSRSVRLVHSHARPT
ncbi:hypothetical protein K435DRAFT_437245 [Dendrothele bispora CBS 962.96]|uniref:Uncharacterized protein n=1 Tax=Dendrothele bispora (strain CBS 962.96) TaxID=1314807 RepID=A0A4S8ME85_DENBC|nr:hypothetical protein K435DRAFT_437245 [Dendrothele bispora CBS 962.96]